MASPQISSRAASVMRRRVVAIVLVVLSLVLLTIYFRESSSGGLHSVQSAGSAVLRPFEVAATRVAQPFRDAASWVGSLASAKSDRDAVFTMQENEAGSLILRWEITGRLLPGQSGVVRFPCLSEFLRPSARDLECRATRPRLHIGLQLHAGVVYGPPDHHRSLVARIVVVL